MGGSLESMLPSRFFQACALAVATVMIAPPAQAEDGQTVHRCAGRHGEIVFSGTPCSAGMAIGASAGATPPAAPDAHDCPTSRGELVERVAAAIGRSDVNALAGLLRWGGIGAGTADGRLRQLRELATRPLLAIEDGGDGDLHVDGVRVRTGGGDLGGTREHEFGISVAAGCHWLAW